MNSKPEPSPDLAASRPIPDLTGLKFTPQEAAELDYALKILNGSGPVEARSKALDRVFRVIEGEFKHSPLIPASGKNSQNPVLLALQPAGYLQAFYNLCNPEVQNSTVRIWLNIRVGLEFDNDKIQNARACIGRSATAGGARKMAGSKPGVNVHFRRRKENNR
jgi:hypothetical protein